MSFAKRKRVLERPKEVIQESAPSIAQAAAQAISSQTPFKFDVKVKHSKYTEDVQDETPANIRRREMIYQFELHSETNTILAFAKCVAAGVRKRFTDLVQVIERHSSEDAADEQSTTVRYEFGDQLYGAWSDAMEQAKMMVDPHYRRRDPRIWRSANNMFNVCIEDETFRNALGKLVAHLMNATTHKLVMKSNTANEIKFNSEDEALLLCDLARALHEGWGVLKENMVEELFE